MNEHVYTLDEGPLEPPEKVHQFRSTVKAWRSKYRRHIGTKQLVRQFKSELPHLCKFPERLCECYVKLCNDKESLPPAAREQLLELMVDAAVTNHIHLPEP